MRVDMDEAVYIKIEGFLTEIETMAMEGAFNGTGIAQKFHRIGQLVKMIRKELADNPLPKTAEPTEAA